MKIRVLHQAIMVALLGAFASTAGAIGDPGKTTGDTANQSTTAAQENNATRGSGVTSPTGASEATSQGKQGTSDLNSGSTDRSANKSSMSHPKSMSSSHGGNDMSANDMSKSSAKPATTSRREMANGSAKDKPYDAALRRCMQGDQSQRESCLDQAIAQYGGS